MAAVWTTEDTWPDQRMRTEVGEGSVEGEERLGREFKCDINSAAKIIYRYFIFSVIYDAMKSRNDEIQHLRFRYPLIIRSIRRILLVRNVCSKLENKIVDEKTDLKNKITFRLPQSLVSKSHSLSLPIQKCCRSAREAN